MQRRWVESAGRASSAPEGPPGPTQKLALKYLQNNSPDTPRVHGEVFRVPRPHFGFPAAIRLVSWFQMGLAHVLRDTIAPGAQPCPSPAHQAPSELGASSVQR
ncbi:hypothetical protein J0S82_017748 [Galemys pyrenaicus]|uniref:Uncharacterized protein n=1 Tax=Galemys pyrenaicus TaxID=202257 RepID=A0A8J6B2G9_GALPY|nr:hypothetical protein J0S82_017748 [Galemys pyrenaicus]